MHAWKQSHCMRCGCKKCSMSFIMQGSILQSSPLHCFWLCFITMLSDRNKLLIMLEVFSSTVGYAESYTNMHTSESLQWTLDAIIQWSLRLWRICSWFFIGLHILVFFFSCNNVDTNHLSFGNYCFSIFWTALMDRSVNFALFEFLEVLPDLQCFFLFHFLN